MSFTIYNETNAPEAARQELTSSRENFGWIPNLHGVMAQAPSVLTAYKTLHALFLQTSFNAQEKTVVWQTINVVNGCHYCVPAHSAIADMMKVEQSLVAQLINNDTLTDPKLEVLRSTTKAIVTSQGKLSQQQLNRFFQAGYTNQQLLEILLGVAQKTLSNYTNHFADTPLDDQFIPYAK
ncbi:hypothetical protein PA25_12500 [Pseudoalteromonas sp. A25]|uniref:carboxymuconolactone decarboxylase family protein n=1 Tax=Pseudoalteromonas sp. A25 TaxID=116092 RepID=UPI001260DD9F|nr:carboxymuconolactone decarboxylase family protein [Pseudoalteromonas sp. A25]BBN81265.1 hypothetical protein PA25_12500 [Pseudoalteromonas sp. A25]